MRLRLTDKVVRELPYAKSGSKLIFDGELTGFAVGRTGRLHRSATRWSEARRPWQGWGLCWNRATALVRALQLDWLSQSFRTRCRRVSYLPEV
jgi:hypothetical protein